MKLKKTAKIMIPTTAALVLAVTLPVVLTSCSSTPKHTNISQSVEWAVPYQQTYFYSENNPQMPILNGNIIFKNKAFDNAIINYQWYKNALPIPNANSSQYVVTNGGEGNYYCKAIISYNNEEYSVQSPVYIVQTSPINLQIDASPSHNIDAGFFANLLGQVDGFNGILSANLTSTDSSINLTQLQKDNDISYKWIQKTLLGDKIVSNKSSFEPQGPGLYYCEVQIIYNGQYLVSRSSYKVMMPNFISSSLSSNINNTTGNNTYYLGTQANNSAFTLTPSFNGYQTLRDLISKIQKGDFNFNFTDLISALLYALLGTDSIKGLAQNFQKEFNQLLPSIKNIIISKLKELLSSYSPEIIKMVLNFINQIGTKVGIPSWITNIISSNLSNVISLAIPAIKKLITKFINDINSPNIAGLVPNLNPAPTIPNQGLNQIPNNLQLATMWIKRNNNNGINPNNPLESINLEMFVKHQLNNLLETKTATSDSSTTKSETKVTGKVEQKDNSSTNVNGDKKKSSVSPLVPSNSSNSSSQTVFNGMYDIVKPMKLGEQSLSFVSNPVGNQNGPGQYILIEALFPRGAVNYDQYSQIVNFKYTTVNVEKDQQINIPGINSPYSVQMQNAVSAIVAQNSMAAFNDPSSKDYQILQSKILQIFGLTGKANVSFVLSSNPGNPTQALDGSNTGVQREPADCYKVNVKFTPLVGYEIVGTNSFESITSIEGTTTLTNFISTINSNKQTFVDDLNNFYKTLNVPETNSQALVENLAMGPTKSLIYQEIQKQINAALPNIGSQTYSYKIELSPNPGITGNFSAKIVFTATQGYGFNDAGLTTYTLDLGQLNVKGYIETIQEPSNIILKAMTLGFKAINNGDLLSNPIFGYLLELAFKFKGKASLVTPVVWNTTTSPYSVTYTFKTNDPNKFLFPNNKTEWSITFETGVTHLNPNHNNPLIDVSPITKISSSTGQTSLSIQASLFDLNKIFGNQIGQILDKLKWLLEFHYQWQESDSNTANAVFTDIAGANKSTYSFKPSGNKYYRCKITMTPILTNFNIGEPIYSEVINVA